MLLSQRVAVDRSAAEKTAAGLSFFVMRVSVMGVTMSVVWRVLVAVAVIAAAVFAVRFAICLPTKQLVQHFFQHMVSSSSVVLLT